MRAATLPVRDCTSLIVFREDISRIALTFLGFASIPLCDTMKSRNFPEETPKAHLDGFQLHTVLSECIERLLKIVQMVLFFFTLDEHIVHIYFHVLLNLFAEHLVYQSLVRGPRILQTERHDPVAVELLTGDEGSLLLILFCHLYLVVPKKGVHKGKKLVPGCRVHKLVNPGQREAVFQASVI